MAFVRRSMLALCALLFMAAVQGPVQAADAGQAPASGQAPTATVQQPQTNAEIRQWYNDQVSVIPVLNETWRKDGVSVEERARRAQDLRHAARTKARDFMQNRQEVAELQARDQEKYGNPDGPTFEQLVQKNRERGLEGDAVYEEIIKSSSRTNREYNDRHGAKPQGQSP